MNAKFSPFPQKNPALIQKLNDSFSEIFLSFDRSKTRFEVFKDFITCSACALRNSMRGLNPAYFSEEIEQEYLKTVNKYNQEDRLKFPQLFGLIVETLSQYQAPHDVLGDLFMRMDFGSKYNGQYFTPFEISYLMSELNDTGTDEIIQKNGFVTISDPACGSGSTLLAKVKNIMVKGYNPLNSIFVEGTDIDRLVALMCYVQLALWNVPAKINVGDTLTMNMRETWLTPAYVMGGWRFKLKA
jgi:type I restriction-modification system DNA methylase subunit